MTILEAIALAARFATLALKVGGDALPFVEMIKKWAISPNPVTQGEIDNLHTMGQPFLDALNDTSNDEGVV